VKADALQLEMVIQVTWEIAPWANFEMDWEGAELL